MPHSTFIFVGIFCKATPIYLVIHGREPVNWVSIANGTFRASPQGLSKVQKEQVMDKSNNKLLLD